MPKYNTYDFVIVGQGLAGTLLHFFLAKANYKSLVINQPSPHAATHVAAGIINPITGRRFVKSWRFDALLEEAQRTYTELEQLLGKPFFYKKNIIRNLDSPRAENDWFSRSYPAYQVASPTYGNYKDTIHHGFSLAEITQGGRIAISDLVNLYRNHLLQRKELLEESFDYQGIKFIKDGIEYKDINAKYIVFCEGYAARYNPYFKHLGYEGAKGEVLMVEIPNANFQKIYKNKIFVVPFEADSYWIGATNKREDFELLPTQEGRFWVENNLKNFLKLDYQVKEHLVAIRPTVKDRRPLLGFHGDYPRLGIFNGLGTKGASLGPFWAKHFVKHIFQGQDLDQEVDIKRYTNK